MFLDRIVIRGIRPDSSNQQRQIRFWTASMRCSKEDHACDRGQERRAGFVSGYKSLGKRNTAVRTAVRAQDPDEREREISSLA
jgi:hypothetical protein